MCCYSTNVILITRVIKGALSVLVGYEFLFNAVCKFTHTKIVPVIRDGRIT